MADAAQTPYAIAVRELCEFAAKAGDLDHRFTPSPSAEEGIAGHKLVASRRPPSWRPEWPLSAQVGAMLLRGRADGFDAEAGVLEEIKTHRGDLGRMPPRHRALHWAQAKAYGALVCELQGRAGLTVRLVYLDIDTGSETCFDEICTASELQAFLLAMCQRFEQWAAAQGRHRLARDEALAALAFPYVDFRAGQRQLAEQVFMVARRGRCLLAQAATGNGKTMGSLFPLLKAMPGERLDKLCFLTAKATGQEAPLAALEQLRGAAVPLRVLQLVARDKACEHPGLACHGESCPLARGFYDRLPEARAEAAAAGWLGREALRQVARSHSICPYYLSQELVRWADVIVADYNYYFDAQALLPGLSRANDWRMAVVVDEAHNLVDRARAMYSGEIGGRLFRQAVREADAPSAKALRKLSRAIAHAAGGAAAGYVVHAGVDSRVAASARNAVAVIGEQLAASAPGAGPLASRNVLDAYFALLHFQRLAGEFGPHSLVETQGASPRTARREPATLGIRNVIPGHFLGPRIRQAHATILLSATLTPPGYYADMLGLPPDHAWLEVSPAFEPHQLEIHVADGISTRFDARQDSARPIAELIHRQFAKRAGNYLVFVSSFDYLDMVHVAFVEAAPQVPCWCQTAGMDEAHARQFLGRFQAGGAGVGFAVLGGSFAEGVDLPGDRCIGVFIATLGLPQRNEVNEAMRRCLEAGFGAGFEYAYLYPGIRKVVQAAGRVVRSPDDHGVLYLIDERYARRGLRALMPPWWRWPTARPESPGR